MTFRLLSCDGGGIRGYMSSLIIEALNKQTGGKLLGSADGFAGTSTGGLITVALADARTQGQDMPDRIKEIVEIYRCDADRIFTENDRGLFSRIEEMLLRLFGHQGGPGVLECQYTANGLVSVAHDLVGDRTSGSIDPALVLAVNSAALEVPKGQVLKGTRG
ncbi:hypothetical protein DEA8626_03507 [Defluviimonas aquaemixtae]|uniref:PNPLA domain-containing protein n=1 Tax=Albidovulum aquaemixtae TaxID=1542388 RepID=A0A2R8BLZ8_9RHOB|nr:patatin-like phospholipase family protein [Defluviimonas aquaemixtae]SPH24455.1 hypothetical protein DEA8626_03507 [Defluviimonas aquaemixtae]